MQNAHRTPRAPRRRRRPCATRTLRRRVSSVRAGDGFTLVEVVVALVLLATAALHVAATSTYLARLAASARAIALATRVTAQVVDSLRAVPCASLGAGSVSSAAGTVSWTVASTSGTRDIRAVLTPTSPRVRQPVVEEALLACD